MSAKSLSDLANFLAATDALMQVIHAFFQKQKFFSEGHSRQREAALSSGLLALACHLIERFRIALSIQPAVWDLTPLDKRKTLIHSLMCCEVTEVQHAHFWPA